MFSCHWALLGHQDKSNVLKIVSLRKVTGRLFHPFSVHILVSAILEISYHVFLVKLGVLSGSYNAVNPLWCPAALVRLLACCRSLWVHWIMFTLCLQWHCSAFTGQWVVPALPHPVLDLLTCLWPLHIPPCPFTPVSCRAAHLATTGCSISIHKALSPYPVSCDLFLLLRGNYFVFSWKDPSTVHIQNLGNPATSWCHCVFGQCEVSPSPFPAAHQLPSVACPREVTTSKTSWWPLWVPFTSDYSMVCDLFNWENPQLGQLDMQTSYLPTASLSRTSVQNYLPPLFCLLFQSLISKLSLGNCSPKAGQFQLQWGTKVCSLRYLLYFSADVLQEAPENTTVMT